MIPLTIIVSAYNRADTLSVLFKSFEKLQCKQEVNLVISIDNKGTEELNALALNYQWHLGKKEVVIHKEQLGLINHFIWVGDQTEKYEHVLFLEDDMYVSPQMLNYALQVIPIFENDNRIAGCSLYNPPFTLSGMVFDKIVDSYDNFFFQHPYWGNIWYKEKWAEFKKYLKTYKLNDTILPITVQTWRKSSFKKIFIQYLIETNRTIVYPRISMITNMGAPGLHCISDIDFVQVPIETVCSDKQYVFSSYDNSLAKYDSFEEIYKDTLIRYNSKLGDYNFVIDTKLNRNNYPTDYVLTTRDVKNMIMTYSSGMKPVENNVLFQNEGRGLSLSKTDDLVITREDETKLLFSNLSAHCPMSKKRIMKYEQKVLIKDFVSRIVRKLHRILGIGIERK